MKVSEMFPRRYATGEDLQGKAVTLTIARVAQEEMRPQAGAPPVKKHVVYFKGAVKGVILSRTLAYQIADAVGDEDTAAWPGKRVTLYPVPLQVAGQNRVAIRARPATEQEPHVQAEALTENEEEW